jgi:hypothetical protein
MVSGDWLKVRSDGNEESRVISRVYLKCLRDGVVLIGNAER